MKKLFLMLLVLVVSCTSNSSQDPLVGTWRYHKSYVNNIEQLLETCEEETLMAISTNGAFITTTYKAVNKECEVESMMPGTWQNLGKGSYATAMTKDTIVAAITFEENRFIAEEVYKGITYKDIFIKQ